MKHSKKNLAVIQNFILHMTHSSIPCDRVNGEDEYAKIPSTLTPDDMYRIAEEYIKEDHVDGEDNPEDHIVTYGAESSFQTEDIDKEHKEYVVIVADFGEDGTQTVATIDGAENLQAVQEFLEFTKSPYYQ